MAVIAIVSATFTIFRFQPFYRSRVAVERLLVNDLRTNPGKVWKVPEFNVEIFKALKSHQNDYIYGKVWKKILENCNADLENTDVCYTVDY